MGVPRKVIYHVHRYLDPKSWWSSLCLSWVHVFTGSVITYITSNGIEATAHSSSVIWVQEAGAGMGLSWKAALLQAALHATYKIVQYINRTTASEPPFRHHPLPRNSN